MDTVTSGVDGVTVGKGNSYMDDLGVSKVSENPADTMGYVKYTYLIIFDCLEVGKQYAGIEHR